MKMRGGGTEWSIHRECVPEEQSEGAQRAPDSGNMCATVERSFLIFPDIMRAHWLTEHVGEVGV